MVMRIVAAGAKAVQRELAAEQKELARAQAPALNAAARKARTRVAGGRSVLQRERGISTKALRIRVRQGRRARANRPKTSIWFGGDPVPAEQIRKNVTNARAKPGTRGVKTRREGLIPRSFIIMGGGNKFFVRRYGRGRGQYARILTPLADDMAYGREQADALLHGIYPAELAAQIEKRRARRAARGR